MNEKFNSILYMDVIEHIENDIEDWIALVICYQILEN